MDVVILAAAVLVGIPGVMALLTAFEDRLVPRLRPPTLSHDSIPRATVVTVVIGLALTVVGEYFAFTVDFYDPVMSDKGEEIEHAFRVLSIFAVPVAALVLSTLLYTLLRRGTGALPPEDGADIEGKGPFPKAWLAVTAGLTLAVMIYPGLTSLPKVTRDDTPDLVVDVKGVQWTWLVTYPDAGVGNVTELVLPVDRTIRFNITSGDVLHAFWVPAFLMKIDAIPGQTTTMSLRATETGEYATVPALRLQCSQLCGLSHSSMRMPVKVVTQAEFDAWVSSQRTNRVSAEERGR
jgi:cytochrome c oxidase subunit 2